MQQLNKTELKWFNQIQEARASGLSDWEWCKQNKVPTSTFYYHIRRLRDKAADLPVGDSAETPQIQEVVKLEVLEEDEENLSVPAFYEEKQPISTMAPSKEPCSYSSSTTDCAVRLQMGNISVGFNNSACDHVILSVINALRQSC